MKKPVNLFVVISLVVIGLLIGNGSAWGEIRLYVVNAMDNTVSVIRLSDNTTLATIPLPPAVGIGPIFVALHPSGLKAYVTGDGSTIHIIDTRSNSVVGGVAISENSSSGLAFVPNTNELLVAMEDANVVRRVNTVTDTVVGPAIPTHNQPVDIIVTQDGTKAFVSCMSGGYIEVIDLTVSPPVVSTSINLSSNNLQVIALNPTETLLYVTDAGNQRVRVFRTSDYVEVTPPGYPALQYPRSLSISIDDTRAFVGERVGPIANSVYVIRLSDGMILQNIYDPRHPHGLQPVLECWHCHPPEVGVVVRRVEAIRNLPRRGPCGGHQHDQLQLLLRQGGLGPGRSGNWGRAHPSKRPNIFVAWRNGTGFAAVCRRGVVPPSHEGNPR